MNYFIKSLWFGALLKPQCWLCALKRNPVMPLLFAAVLFFAVGGLGNVPEYLLSAQWLIGGWALGMLMFICFPKKSYKLADGEKTLHVFIYDAYSQWKIAVDNKNRNGFVRVLENDGHGWRLSDETVFVRGYDDSLVESSGFLLIRRPYSSWQLLGNGYNNDTSVFILGHKLFDYAFVPPSEMPKQKKAAKSSKAKKEHTLYLLHGKKVVSEKMLLCEKSNFITLDEEHTCYAEAEYTQLETTPAFSAHKRDGIFLLVECKESFKLFKLINSDKGAEAYLVYTEWFCIKDRNNQRTFHKSNKGGYTLVCSVKNPS